MDTVDDSRSDTDSTTLDALLQDPDLSTELGSAPLLDHGGRQTGPKGVLADAAYQRYLERAKSQQQAAIFHSQLSAAALVGKKLERLRLEVEQAEQTERENAEDVAEKRRMDEEEKWQEEKQVLSIWREKRLSEIKKRVVQGRDPRPLYRTLQQIGVSQYIATIEEVPPGVRVVVHIAAPCSPYTAELNRALARIAKKYGHARFVTIRASDVEFDELVCPSMVWYDGGRVMGTLIGFWEAEDCGRKGVEEVLIRHGALRAEDEWEGLSSGDEAGE